MAGSTGGSSSSSFAESQVTYSSPEGDSSQGSQEDMSTGTKTGIGLSVTGLIGAGSGFSIYKNFAAVSALIGRIF